MVTVTPLLSTLNNLLDVVHADNERCQQLVPQHSGEPLHQLDVSPILFTLLTLNPIIVLIELYCQPRIQTDCPASGTLPATQ